MGHSKPVGARTAKLLGQRAPRVGSRSDSPPNRHLARLPVPREACAQVELRLLHDGDGRRLEAELCKRGAGVLDIRPGVRRRRLEEDARRAAGTATSPASVGHGIAAKLD